MQDFIIIIPARYESSRLPKKLLLTVNNKPLIQYTYENALNSCASRVIIATDHELIYQTAKKFGAEVYMTSQKHQSGTDRIAECIDQCELNGDAIIVNIQGDEPLLPTQHINQVAQRLIENLNSDMATLATSITNINDLFNTNVVKVIKNVKNHAIYFSRSVIPWYRDQFDNKNLASNNMPANIAYLRHIGIYAYRLNYLKYITALPVCMPEKTESLEQLRVLYNEGNIYIEVVEDDDTLSIDTKEDFEEFKKIILKSK